MAELGGESERERAQRVDQELLVGIRRNELRALREFVRRFEPVLMDQAWRLDIDPAERRTVVTEFLDDILLKLAQSAVPRSLVAFVLTSFRNSVMDLHRAAATRERQVLGQDELIGSERVVRAGCSEFMLRAARGIDAEVVSSGSSDARARLVRDLISGCSVEERQILIWTAHRVPLRECAAWLGISYDTAKQRLSRLRGRLVRECALRLRDVSGSDRAAMTRLLRISGIEVDNDSDRGSAA